MAVPKPDDELRRLSRALQQELPPVILITGASRFLRGEAFDLTVGALPAAAELRRIDGQDKTDGSELDDLRGGSLFAPAAWLAVRRADAWLAAHGAALLPLLAKIGAGSGLLLEVQKLDGRTKLARAIKEVAAGFEFRDPYAEPYDARESPLNAEIVGWIVGRAKAHGLALRRDAAFALLTSVGKEPGELIGELRRLAADETLRGRPLAADDLRGRLSCRFESTPFELAEALLAHDRRRVERSLEAMLERGVRARDGGTVDTGGVFPFVTSWLAQSLGSVHHGRVLLDAGVGADQVARRAGVRVFADRYRAQVEGNPEPRLRRGIILLLETQRRLRTTGEEPRRLLERFVAEYFRS